MDALTEMQMAHQLIRDRAAYHARHAREMEQRLKVNNRIDCKDTLQRCAYKNWMMYQASVRASIIVKNGLERAEMHENKSQVVNTLRAMG